MFYISSGVGFLRPVASQTKAEVSKETAYVDSSFSKSNKATWRKFRSEMVDFGLVDPYYEQDNESACFYRYQLQKTISESNQPLEYLSAYLQEIENTELEFYYEYDINYLQRQELFLLGLLFFHNGDIEKGKRAILRARQEGNPEAWLYVKLYPEVFSSASLSEVFYFNDYYPNQQEWENYETFINLAAEGHYEEALAIPYCIEYPILSLRAFVFQKMGQLDKARECIQLASSSIWELPKVESSFSLKTSILYKMSYAARLRSLPTSDETPSLMIQAKGLEGFVAYQQRDYQKACRAFEEFLAIYSQLEGMKVPSNIYMMLGESYFNLGDYQKAAEYIVESSDVFYRGLRGVAAFSVHDDRAYDLLHHTESYNNDRIAAFLMKIMGKEVSLERISGDFITPEEDYFRQGKYQDVLNLYNERCYLQYQAAALVLQGDYKAAIAMYTKIIQTSDVKINKDLYIERGLVYLLQGNKELALEDLKKAEVIEARYYQTRYNPLFLPKATFILVGIQDVHEK